jgi:hypothetical protein
MADFLLHWCLVNQIDLLGPAAEGLKGLPTIASSKRVVDRVLWLHVAKQYPSLHWSVMVETISVVFQVARLTVLGQLLVTVLMCQLK